MDKRGHARSYEVIICLFHFVIAESIVDGLAYYIEYIHTNI